MCKLNAAASRAALAVGARCATDVTGFGLLGHASHIARGEQRHAAHRSRDRVPTLPGARAAWQRGIRTGGAERNASVPRVARRLGTARPKRIARLLIDPQTSGGLLVAVPAASRRGVSFARSRRRRDRRGRRAPDATVSCLRDAVGSGWSLVALTVFKTVRDLTTSGWVGSIPMHSRHALAGAARTVDDLS